MSQVNDTFAWLKESVSTVFRHILPGILIIAVTTLSKPSWFPQFNIDSTYSIIILGAIAMVIGNAWYVFHRYFILQFIDFVAYCIRLKGQPVRGKGERINYRDDLAKHVSKYFSSLPQMIPMGKHIRDRFSSFNFMFIVAEVFLILTPISDSSSFLHEHMNLILGLALTGFLSALWQYSLVRVIDEEYGKTYRKPRTIIYLNRRSAAPLRRYSKANRHNGRSHVVSGD